MVRELDYRGAFRAEREFDLAVQAIRTRRIDVRPLITAQIPLQRAQEAFELALDRTKSTKVNWWRRIDGAVDRRRTKETSNETQLAYAPRSLAALAAAALLAAPALAQTKLKFAHVYETSEPYHKWAVWAAGEIKQRTQGRYEMEVFPASQLGKETDINQGLTLGTVDVIYTGQAFAARTHPPLAIGGAPFMFRDFDHWKKYSESPVLQELMDGYFKKGGNKPWPSPTTACATPPPTRRSTSRTT